VRECQGGREPETEGTRERGCWGGPGREGGCEGESSHPPSLPGPPSCPQRGNEGVRDDQGEREPGGRVPGRVQGGRVQGGRMQGGRVPGRAREGAGEGEGQRGCVPGRECVREGQGGGRVSGSGREGVHRGGPWRREGARECQGGSVHGSVPGSTREEGGSQGVVGREHVGEGQRGSGREGARERQGGSAQGKAREGQGGSAQGRARERWGRST
jgi:hypothetical protein